MRSHSRWSPRMILVLVSGFLLLPVVRGAAEEMVKRHVRQKPARTEIYPGLRDDMLIIKFAEGSRVRLRGEEFVSLGGSNADPVNALLFQRDGLRVQRLFTRPEEALEVERIRGQELSGRELADLNNYYLISFISSPSMGASRRPEISSTG